MTAREELIQRHVVGEMLAEGVVKKVAGGALVAVLEGHDESEFMVEVKVYETTGADNAPGPIMTSTPAAQFYKNDYVEPLDDEPES